MPPSGALGPTATQRSNVATLPIGVKSLTGSNSNFLNACGKSVKGVLFARTSVRPSGFARLTSLSASRWEAPDLLSTTTV